MKKYLLTAVFLIALFVVGLCAQYSFPPGGSGGSGSIASTTSVLKGNGTGSAVAATAGTDYMSPSTAVQASQMPNPSATTLGGVESITSASHQWIDSISTLGVPHQSQPASTDLSDTSSLVTLTGAQTLTNKSIASTEVTGLPTFPSGTILGTTDTQTLTNKSIDASEIASGTLNTSRLPSLASITFGLTSGAAGTNVGPIVSALRSGSFTKCVVSVKSADGSTALTFRIKQNGTDIFSSDPTLSAGSAVTTNSATTYTFTSLTSSPLTVSEKDVFTIDVTSGTSSWVVTIEVY